MIEMPYHTISIKEARQQPPAPIEAREVHNRKRSALKFSLGKAYDQCDCGDCDSDNATQTAANDEDLNDSLQNVLNEVYGDNISDVISISTSPARHLMPLECEEEELNTCPATSVLKIAMDSGAGDHVINPRDVAAHTLRPSLASKAGRGFIAANGDKILNQGELDLIMSGDDCNGTIGSTFQAADVTRALYSVSRICDNGCEVSFNSDRGIVTKSGREVARFNRSGGLYVATLNVQEPSRKGEPGMPFGRQGSKA